MTVGAPHARSSSRVAVLRDRSKEDAAERVGQGGQASGQVSQARAPSALALGAGVPLPPPERGYFEQRLGTDLSSVRVHPESTMATEMGARGFAAGRDIGIAPGHWQPGTGAFRRLLGHEIAHTMQQAQSGPAVQLDDLPGEIRRESAKSSGEQTPGRLGQLETQARTAADAAFQQQIGGQPLPGGTTGRATQIINHVALELSRVESARARGYQQAVSSIIGSVTMSGDQTAQFWRAFAGNTLWALSGLVPLLGPAVEVGEVAAAAGGAVLLRIPAVKRFLQLGGGTVATTVVGLAGAELAQFSGGTPSAAPTLPHTMEQIQTEFVNVNSRVMSRYRSEAFALTLEFISRFASFVAPENTAAITADYLESLTKGCVMKTLLADLDRRGMLNHSNYTIDTGTAQEAAKNDLMDQITDVWFTNQITTIGMGARAGVLQVQLARGYPDSGRLTIEGGNIVGAGSDIDLIRERLATRQLKDIAIPKVIQMDGKMHWGIADCNWDIIVTGAITGGGPSVMSSTLFGEVTAAPQHVVRWGGHPSLGLPWLAAFHLGLDDLDSDDSRNTPANQQAGAEEVWNRIKDMTLGSVDNSSW